MPTEKEIFDLKTKVTIKLAQNRVERSMLNKQYDALTSIEMKFRVVVVTPAVVGISPVDAIMDPNDPTKIIIPAVVEVLPVDEVNKTVHDVMPKDPVIPSIDMLEARRIAIYKDCDKSFKAL